MKKAIYLLAATALFASCNQEVLVDATNDQQPEVSRRIGFDTFVDKATRAKGTNSNALNDFYPAFNVYGWKVVDGTAAPVFEDVTVSYYDAEEGTGVKPGTEWGDAPKTGWYYKYVRYWDKMATSYQFSAYAPTAATKDVKCDEAGLITIGTEAKPIKVEETNLMENPADKLAYTGFEYDYMTAQSDANSLDKVTLNFKHLQAKLNIRIKLDASITTTSDVTVKSVSVYQLGRYGYYTNAENVGVSGWTISPITDFKDEYVLTADNGYSLNAKEKNYNGYYVLEQLILPQTIKKANTTSQLNVYKEACVYVEYTIGKETFRSYSPLANIFIGQDATDTTYDFEGGKQYTINITVGPKPIVFDAEVTEWETEVEGGLNMN